jgi:hypothetical protein
MSAEAASSHLKHDACGSEVHNQLEEIVMQSVRSSIRAIVLSSMAAVPFMMAVSTAADAADRSGSRKVVRTGPNGQQLQSLHARSIQSGQYSASSSVTGLNGKTATRNTAGNYDREAGTWTRDTVATGPNGATKSVHADVQKTDTGYTRDATRTDPNGQQTQAHTDFVRTDDGYSRDKTVTGPNGKTMTQHTEASFDPATNTATRARTTTGPDGRSSTKEVTRSFTPAK